MGIIVSAAIAWVYAYFNKDTAASLGITVPQGIIKFESIIKSQVKWIFHIC